MGGRLGGVGRSRLKEMGCEHVILLLACIIAHTYACSRFQMYMSYSFQYRKRKTMVKVLNRCL